MDWLIAHWWQMVGLGMLAVIGYELQAIRHRLEDITRR
jgi:hypothetical protein